MLPGPFKTMHSFNSQGMKRYIQNIVLYYYTKLQKFAQLIIFSISFARIILLGDEDSNVNLTDF